MPVYGRTATKANLLRQSQLPALPGGWVYSSVNWSTGFDQHPSGSLEIEGIIELDYEEIESTFEVGTRVEVEGIPFEVVPYGWTREWIEARGVGEVETYKVSVTLQGYWQRKCETPISLASLGGSTQKKRPMSKGQIQRFILVDKSGKTVYQRTYNTLVVRNKPKNNNNSSSSKTQKRYISLLELCRKAGAGYIGPEIAVRLPDEINYSDKITLSSILEDAARSKSCYINYCNPLGIEFIPFSRPPNTWTFGKRELLTDGQNTKQFSPYYDRAEMTWGEEESDDGLNPDAEDTPDNGEQEPEKEEKPGFEVVRVQPKIQKIVEEEDNPEMPPPGTTCLRTLDSCFDNSGPTKQRRISTNIDGVAEMDEVWIWGFEYLAKDIHKGDGVLFNSTPDQFWKVIEYQKTVQAYESIGTLSLRVGAKDKATGDPVTLVVHPAYKNFANLGGFAGSGQLISVTPKVEYQTRVSTTGWKRTRFEKEPGRGQSEIGDVLDEENPRAEVQKFFTLSKKDVTAYKLEPNRLYYRDKAKSEQNLPFNIEYVPYKDLEPWVKRELRWEITLDGITYEPDTTVGLITPNLEYQEPMFVKVESRVANSFAYKADPDNEADNPVPPLVTGEESYFQARREIINEERHKEFTTEYTATDPGYSISFATKRNKDVLGEPPSASSRSIKYEQRTTKDFFEDREEIVFKNTESDGLDSRRAKPTKRYYVTSDLVGKGVESSPSLSFPYAQSKAEATEAAKTTLLIEDMQNTIQEAKQITWWNSRVRAGDRVLIEGKRYRILNASHSLEELGRVLYFPGEKLGLTPGLSLSLGVERDRSVTVVELYDNADNDVSDAFDPETGMTPNSGDGELEATFLGTGTSLGDVLDPETSRRKF